MLCLRDVSETYFANVLTCLNSFQANFLRCIKKEHWPAMEKFFKVTDRYNEACKVEVEANFAHCYSKQTLFIVHYHRKIFMADLQQKKYNYGLLSASLNDAKPPSERHDLFHVTSSKVK